MSMHYAIVLLCFASVLSRNTTRWNASSLAQYANENFNRSLFGLYDPEGIIPNSSSILNEMEKFAMITLHFPFLFIVNKIDCEADKKALSRFTSELAEELKILKSLREDEAIIMVYSVETHYVAFHLGKRVDLTQENIKQLNSLYQDELSKDNYPVFVKMFGSIKKSIEKNENDKASGKTATILGAVFGSLAVILLGIGVFCYVRYRKMKERQLLAYSSYCKPGSYQSPVVCTQGEPIAYVPPQNVNGVPENNLPPVVLVLQNEVAPKDASTLN